MAEDRRAAEIALRTFVKARWAIITLVAGGWAVQNASPEVFARVKAWLPPAPEPTGTTAVLLVLAIINVVTQQVVIPRGQATAALAGASLLCDVTAITVLLALSGGVTNAFTAIYFVPITLSTQVSPRWTWALAGYSLACFAALFAVVPEDPHAHHRHDFEAHMRGMWVAFGVSGLLITYFVHEIAASLARQRAELARLRDERAQDRHLAAMGTLAAGAAHELGTPLGTISMLVADLEYMSAEERGEAVRGVKEALARCKHIIQQMASPELRVPTLGREPAPWPLRDLAGGLAEAAGEVPVAIEESAAFAGVGACEQPREVLGQILRELVANGAEACRQRVGSRGVRVRFDRIDDAIVVDVRDDGVGMSPEVAAAAFDPFFSTKPEGAGMGLGLYLARAHLRQLGGTIDLSTNPGAGTTVQVRFPILRGRKAPSPPKPGGI